MTMLKYPPGSNLTPSEACLVVAGVGLFVLPFVFFVVSEAISEATEGKPLLAVIVFNVLGALVALAINWCRLESRGRVRLSFADVALSLLSSAVILPSLIFYLVVIGILTGVFSLCH